MRFLILSDIHANATALKAALAAAKGRWDRAMCLGDVVGYGPDPNEVIDEVRPLAEITIRGNHDKAASGQSNAEDFNPIARAAAEWTRRQLRPENLDYLNKLQQGPARADEITLVHGAVADEDEYVFAPAQALDSLLESPTEVTFFGHTHFQGGFSYRDNRLDVIQLKPRDGTNFAALQLEKGTRYLLNPGSIGQPRDGDSRAAYLLFDSDAQMVTYFRVPYDIEAAQRRIRDAGLPSILADRLSVGR